MRVDILSPKIIGQEISPTPFFVPHLIYENTLTKGKKTGICYVCQNCGYKTGKWLGRCPECQAWQTLMEEQEEVRLVRPLRQGITPPTPLTMADELPALRFSTGFSELDRVLGGGVMPGSVILIAGDPGIGKSTLLLQMLARIGATGHKVLYVSGEESGQQIRMRARRLGAVNENVLLSTENSLEAILAIRSDYQPALLAVDSIQTLQSVELPSGPGSVTQIRETAGRLISMAKQEDIPVILVGHITKDGAIAGPKILEHMVDTVLYFEGERGHMYRIIRTIKNRYGPTNEIGVFEMKEEGLSEVANPSELFLAERPIDVPGSVVLPSMEGSRPILVEVQALVSPSNLGMPRRTAIGADQQRLSLLTAVLEKKVGLSLVNQDIYLNIAGGIRVEEPALDLGMVCAIASSLLERPIPSKTVVCGEVGLAGEIRGVSHIESRIEEAHRLGFDRMLLPKSNADRRIKKTAMEVKAVANLADVMVALF